MAFPLDGYKYYYYVNENGGKTVTARSTFAGKTVKASAKCNPDDTYSEEKGKELAAARCNQKIAIKRKQRAAKMYMEAAKAANEAMEYLNRMKQYFMDADDALDVATNELNELAKNY